jgi:hypothetical protein
VATTASAAGGEGEGEGEGSQGGSSSQRPKAPKVIDLDLIDDASLARQLNKGELLRGRPL